jgi:hypothetical protein
LLSHSILERYKARMEQKIAQLKREYEEKSKELTTSFDESVKLLLASYETYAFSLCIFHSLICSFVLLYIICSFFWNSYLTKSVPGPSFLPVSLNIHIQSKVCINSLSSHTHSNHILCFTKVLYLFYLIKNIWFKNVLVKPTDNIKDIKRYLIEQFDKMNNPIREFSSNNIFVLKKRFSMHNLLSLLKNFI